MKIYEDRLKGLGLFKPGKEKAMGKPHCSFPIFKGRLKQEGNQLFTQVDS